MADNLLELLKDWLKEEKSGDGDIYEKD